MKGKTLQVDFLARVEGEGGMTVKLKGDTVAAIQFKIFEPPRFFEAFLRGRKYNDNSPLGTSRCRSGRPMRRFCRCAALNRVRL